ncbi:hypothetical protein [Ochrobactrum sp. MYb379]|uniref:hypothetical protein n=1 Tax=Ochrobactrum sp. MYb379 TaxID=2745275 RepID=UPI0030B2CD4E
MNGNSDNHDLRGGVSELALWAGACLVVLSVHVAAVMWLMREPEMAMADDTPPAAIMIELDLP